MVVRPGGVHAGSACDSTAAGSLAAESSQGGAQGAQDAQEAPAAQEVAAGPGASARGGTRLWAAGKTTAAAARRFWAERSHGGRRG
eukprot:4182981-Pyramimonas_sp.AAC.1